MVFGTEAASLKAMLKVRLIVFMILSLGSLFSCGKAFQVITYDESKETPKTPSSEPPVQPATIELEDVGSDFIKEKPKERKKSPLKFKDNEEKEHESAYSIIEGGLEISGLKSERKDQHIKIQGEIEFTINQQKEKHPFSLVGILTEGQTRLVLKPEDSESSFKSRLVAFMDCFNSKCEDFRIDFAYNVPEFKTVYTARVWNRRVMAETKAPPSLDPSLKNDLPQPPAPSSPKETPSSPDSTVQSVPSKDQPAPAPESEDSDKDDEKEQDEKDRDEKKEAGQNATGKDPSIKDAAKDEPKPKQETTDAPLTPTATGRTQPRPEEKKPTARPATPPRGSQNEGSDMIRPSTGPSGPSAEDLADYFPEIRAEKEKLIPKAAPAPAPVQTEVPAPAPASPKPVTPIVPVTPIPAPAAPAPAPKTPPAAPAAPAPAPKPPASPVPPQQSRPTLPVVQVPVGDNGLKLHALGDPQTPLKDAKLVSALKSLPAGVNQAFNNAPRVNARTGKKYMTNFLENGVDLSPFPEMLKPSGLRIIIPERPYHYGTSEMVNLLLRVGQWLKENVPGFDMDVGDMTDRDGGQLPGHNLHQNGLDADLGYIFNQTNQSRMLKSLTTVANRKAFLVDKQWELFKALFREDAAHTIFVSTWVKREMCNYAKSRGEYSHPQDGAFAQKVLGRLRIWPQHEHHFHLLIKCGPQQNFCDKKLEISPEPCPK